MGLSGMAVAMMQRNEGELLSAWVDYYLSLTDAALVTILDNGSYDPDTLKALDRARELGINVVTKYAESKHFAQKGPLIREALSQFQGQGLFLLPCDCDEFLISRNSTGEDDGIATELARLRQTGGTAFRISHYYANFRTRDRYYNSGVRKSFFLDRMPDRLDTGFHMPNLEGIVQSNFAFVHFHNKSLDRLLLAAREKLKFRTPDFAPATIMEQVKVGRHLREYFELDGPAYARKFEQLHPMTLPRAPSRPAFDAAWTACIGAADLDEAEAETRIARYKTPFNHAAHYRTVRMSQVEADFYFYSILGRDRVFEYGMGGSTFFACNAGVQHVGTVETDEAWIRSSTEKLSLSDYIESGVLEIFHRSIGPTKKWGFPLVAPPRDDVARLTEVPPAYRGSDVFLIDGRYRVASGIAIYLTVENPEARIFIHDFPARPAYQHLLSIYEVAAQVDTLVQLKPRRGRHQRAEAMLAKALSDAR
jgi:hypothetical protein